MNAEKPWRFLAACFEWNRYLSAQGEFLSDLPITIDGTCNGLQHIAALRRDSPLARMTNLERSGQPEDIYSIVADRLRAVVEQDRDSGDEIAEACLSQAQIDRDLCKKAVMTTPYGVTEWGMMIQLFESPLTKKLHIPGDGEILKEHVKNYERLAERLLARRDERLKVIWRHLSKNARKMLKVDEKSEKDRIASIVDALNEIIKGPSIYSSKVFQRVSDETKEFLEKQLAPTELSRLNKLLILETFVVEIRRTQGRRMRCCAYLAKKLKQCIQDLVDPDAKLVDWLKSLASARAGKGGGIAWVAPSLFPVSQHAVKMKKHTVGKKPALVFYTRSRSIDLEKQKSKIVPNFIHSLDAAHLALTIDALVDIDIVDVGVIHDGYSVHACFVKEIQTTLCETFVAMHSNGLLQDFHSQQNLADTPKVRSAPELGDFKIERVRDASYLFC